MRYTLRQNCADGHVCITRYVEKRRLPYQIYVLVEQNFVEQHVYLSLEMSPRVHA